MTEKIITLMALAIAASAGYAGTPEVVIAKGSGEMEWPPANTSAMTRVSDGGFHVGILELGEGERFVMGGYSDGADAPSRLGPKGNVDFNASSDQIYDIVGDGDVHRSSGRLPVTLESTPSMADFDLWTDKARYNPGQEVVISVFSSEFDSYKGATVRYRCGATVIKEEPLVSSQWSWVPPTEDFKGYLVDIYRLDADGNEEILGSIGVDVSSDFKRFPRNGYVAWYGSERLGGVWNDVAFLNRRHINVVQFQDWHWKHHHPYCGDAVYKDIANNDVSLDVVKELLKAQHAYNMKSMFYNLGFGALENDGATADGVKEEWYYFKDPNHQNKDYHVLPEGWKSNISLLDPGNPGWQAYLCDRNEEVYSNLDFDGYQVDQLGKPYGPIYDYSGNQFVFADHFPSLLQALKARHPSKSLIMNSVSRHGERQIASSGVVDVCYSELWQGEAMYTDMYSVIKSNKEASRDQRMKTIFATYMNYDYAKAHKGGNFNTPGVLLTDACIFALGGTHLELGSGGKMLCNEYFPNTDLNISPELKDAITRYYDFATAYENYIYDTTEELAPVMTSLSGHKLSIWNWQMGPQPRKIVVHAKRTESGATVLHFLNFIKVNSLSWRDLNGDMPAPESQENIILDIDCDRMVSKVWAATPDGQACVPRTLEFTQQGRSLRVTLPSLLYWTMLVLE